MARLRFFVVLTTAGVLACGRGASPPLDGGPLRVALDTTRGTGDAAIVVLGFSGSELRSMRDAGWSAEQWEQRLRVQVDAGGSVAVAGKYAVGDTAVEFRPLFPFDRGRSYSVRVNPARLVSSRSDSVVVASVSLGADTRAPSTRVVRAYPSSDEVPENLLRIYIEFSGPMSRESGLPFVRLLDAAGREVPGAFLPLDADFWNDGRTRYTLFLDPGRVKTGLVPHEEAGRALRAGQKYAIEVDPRWRDQHGLPLAEPFRWTFTATSANTAAIDLAKWKVAAPAARTRDPLTVTFPNALDRALLFRALGVASAGGRSVPGDVEVERGERVWRFTPREPWRSGGYDLVVLSILEDPVGNRVGRAFEVDMFERVDATTERFLVPFTVTAR